MPIKTTMIYVSDHVVWICPTPSLKPCNYIYLLISWQKMPNYIMENKVTNMLPKGSVLEKRLWPNIFTLDNFFCYLGPTERSQLQQWPFKYLTHKLFLVNLLRPDMEKHSEFAKIQYFANLHKDTVLGIKYLAHNQTGKYLFVSFTVGDRERRKERENERERKKGVRIRVREREGKCQFYRVK